MPWKYESSDGIIEIVVEPNFSGSLVDLARRRVVYIVDTPQNKKAIDDCWAVGAELDLCEVNRSKKSDPDDRDGNLLKILQLVDTHYYPYRGFVVHGTSVGPSLIQSLTEKGISVTEATDDGFVASIAEDAPKSGFWALTEFLAKENRGDCVAYPLYSREHAKLWGGHAAAADPLTGAEAGCSGVAERLTGLSCSVF